MTDSKQLQVQLNVDSLSLDFLILSLIHEVARNNEQHLDVSEQKRLLKQLLWAEIQLDTQIEKQRIEAAQAESKKEGAN